tara:strand:- start:1647 stop:2192 length:546 start_codon:yes stop_codon:yes gene_type:complete
MNNAEVVLAVRPSVAKSAEGKVVLMTVAKLSAQSDFDEDGENMGTQSAEFVGGTLVNKVGVWLVIPHPIQLAAILAPYYKAVRTAVKAGTEAPDYPQNEIDQIEEIWVRHWVTPNSMEYAMHNGELVDSKTAFVKYMNNHKWKFRNLVLVPVGKSNPFYTPEDKSDIKTVKNPTWFAETIE